MSAHVRFAPRAFQSGSGACGSAPGDDLPGASMMRPEESFEIRFYIFMALRCTKLGQAMSEHL